MLPLGHVLPCLDALCWARVEPAPVAHLSALSHTANSSQQYTRSPQVSESRLMLYCEAYQAASAHSIRRRNKPAFWIVSKNFGRYLRCADMSVKIADCLFAGFVFVRMMVLFSPLVWCYNETLRAEAEGCESPESG
jgi:hypothetical protein